MYGIFTYKTGLFLGQMLVNIPAPWSIWAINLSLQESLVANPYSKSWCFWFSASFHQPFNGDVNINTGDFIKANAVIRSGWWLTYPSEKYEFVSWDDYSPYTEK